MALDSYTLAAFLSGELPTDDRPSVAAQLLLDDDAREVLAMATDALSAVMSEETTRTDFVERISRPPARPGRRDRVARRGIA